jgi:uncharacterized Rossmann fold enzyme
MRHCGGRRRARVLRRERERLELEKWLPVYREILADFGFDEAADIESARLLSSLTGSRSGVTLEAVISRGIPSTAVVCGGGDSLDQEIEAGAATALIVAADGATSTLLSHGVLPGMIVTDLDGDVEDQIRANSEGSVVFVHAHGDNMDSIRKYVPRFEGEIVCTCQCPPVEGVFNFGGFTDGDRAACIIASMGVRTIRLLGFDFETPSAKPGRSPLVKVRKLVWAKRILSMLAEDGVCLEPSPDAG